MKLVCVVGTRPQLIKLAAVWPVLHEQHDARVVDTGQHYDDDMAGNFFVELSLPRPDHQLGVGAGSHAQQLALMLQRLEPILVRERPDAVVVFGDTNSTLAGALAAAKLELSLAHVEAGLRSFDRRMPEEINRVVADHLSDVLFAPTDAAVANLGAEGIGRIELRRGPDAEPRPQRVVLVGDLMQDLCAATVPQVRDPAAIARLAPANVRDLALEPGGYIFSTVHRAENRHPEAIGAWKELLAALDWPIVLALHPGTLAALEQARARLPDSVRVVPPQGYRTTLALQLHAAGVVTDSGGVQREATWLGVPTLVLRETTEWPETLAEAGGSSVLVGRDVARARAALGTLGVDRDTSAMAAASRARDAHVPPAGAAVAISRGLSELGP